MNNGEYETGIPFCSRANDILKIIPARLLFSSSAWRASQAALRALLPHVSVKIRSLRPFLSSNLDVRFQLRTHIQADRDWIAFAIST